MNNKQFKMLWAICQIILFILPIIACLWYVPYDISYDQKYVNSVNQRAFENGDSNKLTDFKEATIAQYDAEGTYIEKEWKLNNQELYIFKAIIAGIIIGATLQFGNMIWFFVYQEK